MARAGAVFRDARSREVIATLLSIHFPQIDSIVDLTWGKGAFWSGGEPIIGLDIAPRLGCMIQSDARWVPLCDQSVDLSTLVLFGQHDTSV